MATMVLRLTSASSKCIHTRHMPGHASHWERQVGDGIIHDGPCIVKTIIMQPEATTQRAHIYDGRDPTSGTLFCRLRMQAEQGFVVNLGDGVEFGRGIYADLDADDDAITVCFVPL